MSLEDFDQPFVLGLVFLEAPELVTRRAERAARCVPERRDSPGTLLVRIDHILGQRADDAVAASIDILDLVAVLARGLDNATGGGVDDGSDSARLGVERVSGWHARNSP